MLQRVQEEEQRPDAVRRFSAVERLTLIATVAALGLTAALVAIPTLRFAYRSAEAHAALEAGAALTAVVAALLVAQRFRRTRLFDDFVIACGLGVLAASNTVFSLVIGVAEREPSALSSWAPLLAAPIGLLLLAIGSFAGPRMPRRPTVREAGVLVWAVPIGVIGLVALAVVAIDPAVPDALDPATAPENSSSVRLDGPVVVLVVQGLAAVACAVAAVGFARFSHRHDDALRRWLALAMVLGAFSRVNYSLYPSLFAQWVYSGDVFRLASYAAILLGSLREITGYQDRLVRASVLEDRRRIARELHDGLAHEIAFILGLVRTKAEEEGWDRDLRAIGEAAERAMSESREAITTLDRAGDEPLRALLGDPARLMAERAGARLRLDVPHGLRLPTDVGQALLRIVREAVANATRHGGARTITIRVWEDGALHLHVADDGTGFAVDEADAGLGLRGMADRAADLGGVLALSSSPEHGTEVQVTLPQMSR